MQWLARSTRNREVTGSIPGRGRNPGQVSLH